MQDLLGNLAMGFGVALSLQNIGLCFIGCALGTAIGVLPGIGPLPTVALLLPFTFSLDPTGALIMLAGVFYGAQYGGSTTAILARLPGETSSVVTCLDGYAMALKGQAGTALALAAIGSLLAGMVTTLLIAAAGPPLADIALLFHSADYVSVMVLGLISAVVMAHGSVLKALLMILLGLLLGSVGTDVATGEYRFTLGLDMLADGIGFVPISMGLFGLAEIMINLENRGGRGVIAKAVGSLWPPLAVLRQALPAMLRGTAIGAGFGIMPGGGPTIASFSAYSLEKKMAAQPARFGHGAVEGVAAPEAANNAATQSCFIPMLCLGIPPNALMALMVGAMMVHGIQPGPSIITKQPELFWGMIASMAVGNIILVILNLPLIGIWVRLLQVPYAYLFPAIIVFCAVGTYTVDNSTGDVVLMAVFGVLGYVFRKLDCEPAPLMLGLVLGPLLEENFRRAMVLADGDVTIFVTRPISLGFLLAAAALLAAVLLPSIRRGRQEAFRE
ncbi:tripartite tricarboxylate transporter permease [Siccirubricoccus phaeus]|uniref:tripartite tricarboxylate transporter permease n=1 Tax=Siccirubricoccus phaeus TaxID=2595053 RepID=UPI0011F0D8BB|nr:tripartite tricarboxylate transporter permease [Siccirubricoccus phaeus]